MEFRGFLRGFFLFCVWVANTESGDAVDAGFHFWLPFLYLSLVLMVLGIGKLIMKKRLPSLRPKGMIGIGLLLLVFVWILLGGIYGSPQGLRWHWRWSLLVPHASWLFLMTWFVIWTIVVSGNRVRSYWEGQSPLHRAKTADISSEGIVVSDGVSRLEYRWEGLVGWKESKTLVVVFLSQRAILFFPKSAFGSEEELAAMRALAELIPNPRATGFAVLGMGAKPPPLPVRAGEGGVTVDRCE
jgi:YcxB-like protein